MMVQKKGKGFQRMEKKKETSKKELMEKYNIKSVQGGSYGNGFFDCLRAIDKKTISIFKQDHVIKRIKFAQENQLPHSWLINQLQNDYKRKIGINKKKVFP